MMSVGYLVDLYFELDAMVKKENLDQDVFKLRHDEYAKRYQKLDYAAQGEICAAINARR